MRKARQPSGRNVFGSAGSKPASTMVNGSQGMAVIYGSPQNILAANKYFVSSTESVSEQNKKKKKQPTDVELLTSLS